MLAQCYDLPMADDDAKRAVQDELSELKGVAASLSAAEIKDGSWFAKLLQTSLEKYMEHASWEFFTKKYPGLPADAIVDRRIELAQRYAMIEGGISAGAYSAAIAATIGTAGGASPFAIPAAVSSLAIDLLYLTRLQLRLAYDLSVLYGHPIDRDDPEDLYDLLRVAFGVKAGEAMRGAVPRLAPEAVRQGVKAVVKGPVLAALKALPVIGRFLLQRNIIKFAIPGICIPAAMKMNHYFTGQIGKQARLIFRDKAAVREFASRAGAGFSEAPELLLHTIWYVAHADEKIEAEESWLLRGVLDNLRASKNGERAAAEFERMFDFDRQRFLENVRAQPSELRQQVFEVALDTAVVDHEIQKQELASLNELAAACGVEFDPKALKARAKRGISGSR
jgi:uncharacterized protein (DUF697 family)